MSAARVSPEQRAKMLEFNMAHADFARGRVTGPDAARTKKILIGELSLVQIRWGLGLLKCRKNGGNWEDWKFDTKAKAIKIRKYRGGTGGGPCPAPLSQTEDALLEFCGIEMVEGLAVPDPLEESASLIPTMAPASPRVSAEVLVGVSEGTEGIVENDPAHRKKRDYPLRESLERQAAAIESLAASLNRLADNVASATAALLAIAVAIEVQPKVIVHADEN